MSSKPVDLLYFLWVTLPKRRNLDWDIGSEENKLVVLCEGNQDGGVEIGGTMHRRYRVQSVRSPRGNALQTMEPGRRQGQCVCVCVCVSPSCVF